MRDIKPNFRNKSFDGSSAGSNPDETKSKSTYRKSISSHDLRGSSVPVAHISAADEQKDLAASNFARKSKVIQSESTRGTGLNSGKRNDGSVPVYSLRLGSRERLIVGILLAIAGVTSGLAAIVFLPKADVQLILRTAPLLVDEKIIIAAKDNTSSDVIPGSSFFRELEVSGMAPVVSTEIVGEKARGKVVLINRTLEEQKIKSQSRLITSDNKLYYMLSAANIPAAQTNQVADITVEVEAAEAGSSGNVSSGKLNFAALDESARSVVYAEIRDPITGGSGETVPVVKDTDMAAARVIAQQEARRQVEEDIRAELPTGWVFLEESWEEVLQTFISKVNESDRESQIPYQARATVRVIGFEQSALENHLRGSLEKRLDKNFMLFPGPISFTKTVDDISWDKGQATIAVRVTHTTIPEISLETLREKLNGRPRSEAQAYLEGLAGVRSASVKTWPFWTQSFPRINGRIVIDLAPERQP